MSSVDNRLVAMNFDNSKFASGVSGTLSALDKLKASLNLDGATKGLHAVNAAASGFDSAPMERGVGRIGSAFTAMQTVAFGALTNIGARLSNMATQMVSSFTTDPLVAGFQEYELKMGSIQTILANTSKHGTTLETVNHELEVLNAYADQTIYNFGDMTKNIGLFTNAGIKVEDATTMIKGFSNAAAASGTNAEQAAHAAQQLSQGLSAGKITAQDWISLTNAGMGNKNMQEGLIALGEAMGTFSGSGYTAVEAGKNFKNTLEGGWVTTDVMSSYLRIMSGDMDDASIAALGLNEAQVKMLRDQATMGFDAATKVRTLTQLMSTLRESVGSGWSESFALLFGDFNEATELFTNLNNGIGGWLGNMSKARNEMIKEFVDPAGMNGRVKLIEALQEAFWALARIFIPLGRAWRDTFAAMDAERLLGMVEMFRDFVDAVYPSNETMELLQRTFQGFFGLLGIGWLIIKGVAEFLVDLFLGFEEGDKGILKVTAAIGDFIWNLYHALREGKGIQQFFAALREAIMKVVNPIKDFGSMIGDVFGGVDTGALGDKLGAAITGLLTFGDAADKGGGALERVKNAVVGFFKFFGGLGTAIANAMAPFTEGINNMFSGIDSEQVMQGMQTGLLAGLVVVIKQLGGMFKGLDIFAGAGGGIVEKIREGLDSITGTLSAMQANLKASVLLKIAGAIALLAVSVVLLAGVDGPGLMRATAALTAMFIQLGVAMAVFQSIGTVAGIVRLNLMGSALILLSIAVLILTSAVKRLAELGWEELAKGLLGLGGIILGLIAMSKGIDKSRGQILRASVSMIFLAVAIGKLVDVVRQLGEMDFETLRQGLIGVGLLLLGLALFTRLAAADKAGLTQGAGILLLAMGIRTLADAVKIMGDMSYEEIARGMTALAAGLVIIGAALHKMPGGVRIIIAAIAVGKVAGAFLLIANALKVFETISWDTVAKGMIGMVGALAALVFAMMKMPKIKITQAAGIVMVAFAIKTLGDTIKSLGAMENDALAQGLIGIAAAMAILVVSLRLMSGTLGGALAVMVVAGALAVLAPILQMFSNMSIGQIAAGLGMLAGVFVVLGLAGLVLAPVIPALMGLGIAMGLLGAAMFLAGAGLALFAVGLTALSVAGAAGVASLVAIVTALVGLIPMIATQIGIGLVALLTAIGNSGVALTKAFVNILSALLDAIIRIAPKLGQTLLVLIATGIRILLTAVPMIADAGLKLLIGLLSAIANNIGRVVDVATSIIVNFINGITRNLPRIIQAGVDLIVGFVNGLANAIRNNSARMGDAGGNLATAIVEGMARGIAGGAGRIVTEAKNMASRALEAAKDFLGIASPSKEFKKLGEFSSQGFLIGLKGGRDDIKKATDEMFNHLKTARQNAYDDARAAERKMEDLEKKRIATLHDREAAYDRLRKAQAREVGSNAKTASARNAEIRREQDAKNAAIRSAQERLYDLDVRLGELRKATALAAKAKKEADGEHWRASQGLEALSKGLLKHRQELWRLGGEYDKVTKKLDDANKKLADAKKVRDDYNRSIRDQYNDLPEVNNETKYSDYIKNLEKSIIDTQKFTIAIGELRRRGLNDKLYKELVELGPEQAMGFVQEVLAGGSARVNQLNTLGASLFKASSTLSSRATASLYQAGVNAAQGLVDGLKKQQKSIDAQMERIAVYMAKVMKQKLGIRSPSRVFAEIGKYSGEGLVAGLEGTSAAVGKSAEGVGKTAIDSMRKTISGLGALLESDVDMNPTIAPVLDLTSVRKDADALSSLLNVKPIDLGSSYSRASSAASGVTANAEAAGAVAAQPAGNPITFIQNNNSPRALSNATIYRQTRNQISTAKGVLRSNVGKSRGPNT